MSQENDFLSPACTRTNLDRFVVRSSILAGVKEQLPLFAGTLLDVGCGQMPYKPLVLSPPSRATHYIGLDLARAAYAVQPDLVWDEDHIPLSDSAVECVLATEVFEHCPAPERAIKDTANEECVL